MASRAAQKRLTREYKTISENPPPYITAHPSDTNILEWHYIITGPENTPYHGGQYWGTLMFPPDYPFAPPAIRMHTPSGRFQPSTRLCLSISDFHPRSFNPAWEVSTILIGLLSFMTSEEMTTGSVSASEAERKFHAARSRWWNSTGGGSHSLYFPSAGATSSTAATPATTTPPLPPAAKKAPALQKGNVKAGDGGLKFRAEWPLVDKENWVWMREHRIDPETGNKLPALPASSSASASPSSSFTPSSSASSAPLRTGPQSAGGSPGSSTGAATSSNAGCASQLGMGAAGNGVAGGSGMQTQAVVEAVRQGRGAGQGWLARNKLFVFGGLVFVYVLIARLLGGDIRPEGR